MAAVDSLSAFIERSQLAGRRPQDITEDLEQLTHLIRNDEQQARELGESYQSPVDMTLPTVEPTMTQSTEPEGPPLRRTMQPTPKMPTAPAATKQPSMDQLETALRHADAAGDTAGAKVIADAIRQQRKGLTTTKPEIGMKEKIAGFPLTRAAAGAAYPVLGAGQAASHLLGMAPETVDQSLTEFETAKRAGMKYWAEQTGVTSPEIDWAGLAGALYTTSKMPFAAPETAWGRMLYGAKLGGTTELLAPVTHPVKNYAAEKAKRATIGVMLGGSLPGLIEGGRAVGTFGRDLADLTLKTGPARILTNYIRDLVGQDNLAEVVSALRNVKTFVAGSEPTAAEAMVGRVAGSPIQAHQKAVAQSPGGVSAQFVQRWLDKDQARLKATEQLNRDLDRAMSDMLNTGNTSQWRAYLGRRNEQLMKMEADIEREAKMYEPLQKTAVSGKTGVEEVEDLPHILSRPIVVANFLMRLMRGDINPEIKALAARWYLNPKELGDVLANAPMKIDPRTLFDIERAGLLPGMSALAYPPVKIEKRAQPTKDKASAAGQALGVSP